MIHLVFFPPPSPQPAFESELRGFQGKLCPELWDLLGRIPLVRRKNPCIPQQQRLNGFPLNSGNCPFQTVQCIQTSPLSSAPNLGHPASFWRRPKSTDPALFSFFREDVFPPLNVCSLPPANHVGPNEIPNFLPSSQR